MDRRDVRGALVIGAAHLAVPGGILLIAESERPGEGWSRAMGLPDFPGFPPLLAYGGAVAALAFALAARRGLGASRAAGLIVALDLVVLAVAGVLGHDVSTVLSFAAVPLVAAGAVLGRRPVTD